MILLFNHLPVSAKVKVELFLEKAKKLYGSEYYNIQGHEWLGDSLTVESLLPSWIIKKYNEDPSNVLIIPIIQNYLRWLFSLDYGYGAQMDWENIRSPLKINSKLLQGIAEDFFPGADFSSDELKDSLENIRKFSVQSCPRFFERKGSLKAIRYCLVTLLGYSNTTTKVYNVSPYCIKIKANITDAHKPFIEEYLVPAGVFITYESV